MKYRFSILVASLLALSVGNSYAQGDYTINFTNPNPFYTFTLHPPSPVNPGYGRCMHVFDVPPGGPVAIGTGQTTPDYPLSDKNAGGDCVNKLKSVYWPVTITPVEGMGVPAPTKSSCIIAFYHGVVNDHWKTEISDRDSCGLIETATCDDNNCKNTWAPTIKNPQIINVTFFSGIFK